LEIKQLLSTNLTDLQEEIISDELPKTFREAVQFCRTLGLRYLWIDSLCIMQNSSDDWIKQSADMENIYRYATCNIAASAAVDGSAGCFTDRDPRFAEIFRVRLPSLPQDSSCSDLYDIMSQSFWSGDISKAPLSARAWVLQEQFLSPRVIHCGPRQLLWECCELVRALFVSSRIVVISLVLCLYYTRKSQLQGCCAGLDQSQVLAMRGAFLPANVNMRA
jgi:hypothetical protein